MVTINIPGLEPVSDLIKEIYVDLAKPGVQNVGIALSAVLGLGVTIMWPLIWANARAKIALENNLEAYRERLQDIPSDQITVAPSEIALPIAEKLGYVTNEELKQLYIELLAKASIKDLNKWAHPGFVNIINSLSPDEAKLIKEMFPQDNIPFIKIIVNFDRDSWIEEENPVVIAPNTSLTFPENMGAYISNLIGVGLLEVVESGKYISDNKQYEPHMDYFEKVKPSYNIKYQNYEKWNPPYEAQKGIIKVTKLGHMFYNAIYK